MPKRCRIHHSRLALLVLLWLIIYLALSLAFFAYLRQPNPTTLAYRQRPPPIPNLVADYQCPNPTNAPFNRSHQSNSQQPKSNNVTRRVLLLVHQNPNAPPIDHRPLEAFFSSFKAPVRVEAHSPGGAQLLLELDGSHARFALVVFADFRLFHALSRAQKEALRAYCARHSVSIISFLELAVDSERWNLAFANFTALGGQTLTGLEIDPEWARIGRAGAEWSGNLPGWTLFKPTLSRLKPVLWARNEKGDSLAAGLQLDDSHVLFGARPDQHWMLYMALLDTLARLAPNLYNDDDLDRYVQVDIDDVFVGTSGTRLLPDDVRALSATQSLLRRHIPGFRFTLGFSGYYFRHGDPLEQQGDEALVANAADFHWFPHMWRHNHAHEHTADYLLALMAQNRMFAQNVGIRPELHYAVAPQHSGVYPIYQPLYDAWEQIWSVRVTSTEEYPHLKPANKRRAFMHGNVTVLPRQTCGLFTHTLYFHAYPDGGLDRFLANIFGGDLFSSLLLNRHSIFMTHQQNFGHDRLGPYTFRNLVKFVECWTNLRLKWTRPEELARMYMAKFPEERTLLYTNPCDDPRHKRSLPAKYNCTAMKLPNLIILGPQKTGTSALGLFLTLHPNISTNSPIVGSFEELQFFAGPNYARGLDWYAAQFPANSAAEILFEKTANYFDNPRAPETVHALLPGSKLVVILVDPVQRAYSWYQHMKAHNDSAASKYSAEQIFMGNSTAGDEEDVLKLQRRCLGPGLFAHHLDRWLDHFPPSQLILLDGHRLRVEPHFVLSELFAQLQLPPLDGMHRLLRFSPTKGFYCVVRNGDEQRREDQAGQHHFSEPADGTLHCLGHGKGRHYEPMSSRLRQHLEAHFAGPNSALRALLRKYNFRLPTFLLAS